MNLLLAHISGIARHPLILFLSTYFSIYFNFFLSKASWHYGRLVKVSMPSPVCAVFGLFFCGLLSSKTSLYLISMGNPLSLCQRFTCRAHALRINWTNPNPNLKREIHFGGAEKYSNVLLMEFLPGRGNRWLVSVTIGAFRECIIQCWDLTVLQPVCVAKLTYKNEAYNCVVINNDPSSPAIMAIQSKPEVTEIITIDFEEKDPESAFIPLSAIDGRRTMHLLSGSTLVTKCLTRDGKVSIWDISDRPHEKIQLVSSSLLQEYHCRAMHLCHDYLIIFIKGTVELYSTIPRPNNIATPGVPISYPLAQHSFHYEINYEIIDNVNMSEQVSWHAARLHRPSPINIVIRFWPGDTLHHFVLDPNPAYVPGRETSLYNLPYLVQPTLVQTICSPALSNLKSHFALGRYGTMLLLDNHYLDLADRMEYSDFLHQRLSVRILTATGGSSTNQHGSQDSMAFRARGGSYWNRAAIDEESGRIVVSNVDGTITLFEYL
ncbi:uncharacterized protein F5891DRAFT_226475 [Suillus fuscotomentosus]|uniref:Uncharacterized protein n=1 Tax=Suillus fuscotomentosus TaxID=1912939 RepID=A0AAD4EL44_9AGAM|nr:uncharacterized protein F5891DRAFT_226475 [Suillus fuscotomentosus]KAG1908091.1 hypothetical protein F5891DRAFT_226475 [Suillus fuscotomentosus]